MAANYTEVLSLDQRVLGFYGTMFDREYFGHYLASISCGECGVQESFMVSWPPEGYTGEPARRSSELHAAARTRAGEIAVAMGVCTHIE